MLSKKRRGDLPEDATNGSGEAIEHDDVDESNRRQQFAVMQAQRDEARAELTAARLEIERARAAALAPCSRCRFHPKWTVRVRTMAGQVHTIECPDGPTTLVFHVKQKLAQFDHKWLIHEQLALVLPCEASSSAGTISNISADSGATDSALVNDRTLASYGVSSGDLLELPLEHARQHPRGIAPRTVAHGPPCLAPHRPAPPPGQQGRSRPSRR